MKRPAMLQAKYRGSLSYAVLSYAILSSTVFWKDPKSFELCRFLICEINLSFSYSSIHFQTRHTKNTQPNVLWRHKTFLGHLQPILNFLYITLLLCADETSASSLPSSITSIIVCLLALGRTKKVDDYYIVHTVNLVLQRALKMEQIVQ